MKAEISIRPATVQDLPVILHHRREMFRSMGYTDARILEPLEPIAQRYFVEAFKSGTFRGWMAVEPHGKIVGGAGIADYTLPPGHFASNATRQEIINVYVEPEFRRQGIAKRLMEVMIEWCRDHGYSSVYLHASEEGRPLYTSMGFAPTPEMRLSLK
ncbi:MAG TPA: GNAT family N-acetyltransferase [Terriglobia bacterium]|nr:GNAT family N-acetyltransferase [Terriglobia bacterium]